ncbi:MAG: hypothetical protein Q9165_008212 [Trypethelium subeluteriae]
MDPISVTTSVIAIASAICKSYERISKFITLIRNAPKELEGLRSRAESLSSLVANLKQVLEESAMREVIEKDDLALSHVKALDVPMKAVECSLDEVADKLTSHYRFNVLRVLGTASKNPAKTLRTYAKSILETPKDQNGVSNDQSVAYSLPSPTSNPSSPLLLDERRHLAKKKLHLQRELLQAARRGDYLDVSLLLGEGAETEWTDESEGMTALHLAARYGHLRVAEILLEAGADIEAKTDAFGDDWVVRTEKGRTPLIWAAAGRDCPHKQERMCRFLLDKGADVDARNYFARTALQEAAMSARYHGIDPRATMELMLKHGAHVNAYDMNGWTALTECGLYGQKEVAELLLDHGAQVDGNPGNENPSTDSNPDVNERLRETPLVVCGEWSWNEDLICLLLDKGADTESKDKHGKTMAELASEKGRRVILDKLDRINELRSKGHKFGEKDTGSYVNCSREEDPEEDNPEEEDPEEDPKEEDPEEGDSEEGDPEEEDPEEEDPEEGDPEEGGPDQEGPEEEEEEEEDTDEYDSEKDSPEGDDPEEDNPEKENSEEDLIEEESEEDMVEEEEEEEEEGWTV